MRNLTRAFGAWRAERRTISELSRLSERELEDCGFAPGDIRPVARAAARRNS